MNKKQVPGQTTVTVGGARRKESIAEILPNLLQSESLGRDYSDCCATHHLQTIKGAKYECPPSPTPTTQRPKKTNTRFEKRYLISEPCTYVLILFVCEPPGGSRKYGRRDGRKELLTHLVFVEFQYTMCLFAAAAVMMLKRRTVAVHAGTAPGVRATEPMLVPAKAGQVVANTGEETERSGEKKCFCSYLSNLLKCRWKKQRVARHLLQSDMMQRVISVKKGVNHRCIPDT